MQTPFDPCLIYRRVQDELEELLGLQVDGTLYAGTGDFIRMEAEGSKRLIP